MNDGTTAWALEEFGNAHLGHERRNTRLVSIAETLARVGGGTISSVFSDSDADREGAYRFVENNHVKPVELTQSSLRASMMRA